MAVHSVLVDDGGYFDIVPNLRKVSVPTGYMIVGAKGDHKSEIVTFRCPITIDGHEVADCDMHWINWAIGGKSGKYEIDRATITKDDKFIYFNWVITEQITCTIGYITFAVHFEDMDANGEVCYRWSTSKNTDLLITDTQYNSDDEQDMLLYVDIDENDVHDAVNAGVFSAIRADFNAYASLDALKAESDRAQAAEEKAMGAGTAAGTAAENAQKTADAAKKTADAAAPKSHAATGTDYGASTGTLYGHVRLSDSTTSDSAAGGGYAATPAAVKAAKGAADAAQKTADAAQKTAGLAMPKANFSFNKSSATLAITI